MVYLLSGSCAGDRIPTDANWIVVILQSKTRNARVVSTHPPLELFFLKNTSKIRLILLSTANTCGNRSRKSQHYREENRPAGQMAYLDQIQTLTENLKANISPKLFAFFVKTFKSLPKQYFEFYKQLHV